MTGGSGRGCERHSGLGQVLRIPEFRALWAAELVSVGGDQLARVGLSVLVFGRTGAAVVEGELTARASAVRTEG